jgi:predicted house-cleaning noncanonical NTP pyrophosphatase (MazG superfamily)
MKTVFNKLVRDNIPDIIEARGHKVKTKTVEGPELFNYLCMLLTEEAGEFASSRSIYELVDLFEVIYAIMEYMDITLPQLWDAMEEKSFERGLITKGTVLEYVEEE